MAYYDSHFSYTRLCLYDKANQIHQSQALRPQVYIIYLVRMIWVEIF